MGALLPDLPGSEDIEMPKENQFLVAWNTFRKNKAAVAGLIIILLLVLIVIFAKWLMPYDPYVGDMAIPRQAPSWAHIFGTDELGRDIFSRIIDGAHVSLGVGVLSIAIALSFGTVLGMISAYYGRWVDIVIMRFMDMLLAIPGILLAIAIMTALGPGMGKAIVAISIVSIPGYARIVRGSILSVKEQDYIAAARVVGNSNARILFRHIFPNVVSPLIVRSSLGISEAILEAASLGFLGLGVQPPYAEWGTMLGTSKNYIFQAPHMLIFPGIAITIAVLAFNLFGDGLRDALDPRSGK